MARSGLEERARRVRLLILDVDGVLTDGRVMYTDQGAELKAFDVKDGHGVKRLLGAGVDVVWLSSRESEAVARRAKELGVAVALQGVADKLEAYGRLLDERRIPDEQVAYVGDDLPDLPLLQRVGLALAVADAVEEVKAVAHYVTRRRGGRGAVREVCEMILRARGC
ncbi:MAG: HAD-IIIA family hydrolase [Deltaproteobacteria bacterium]|nr:HAD-IIIA family hydrolase [Deltaproteobacteria bacterium]MBI3077280.1 HAD-IIIA family hydrolase [Deltaproteobacteria bacterium]